jgi:hypothetical protein
LSPNSEASEETSRADIVSFEKEHAKRERRKAAEEARLEKEQVQNVRFFNSDHLMFKTEHPMFTAEYHTDLYWTSFGPQFWHASVR